MHKNKLTTQRYSNKKRISSRKKKKNTTSWDNLTINQLYRYGLIGLIADKIDPIITDENDLPTNTN
jgi:hypothetical protein